MMEKERTVIIANMAEAFRKQESRAAQGEEGQKMIRENLALAQRGYFWEKDNKLVITPLPIPKKLEERNRQILGWHEVENLSPQQTGLDLSSLIFSDQRLWSRLTAYMAENPSRLTSYALTPELYSLLDRLRSTGLNFIHNENTPDVAIVDYLGSKAGFRQVVESLARTHPEVKIPQGFICESQAEAIRKALWFTQNGKLCVIKASQSGGSGWGTLLLRRDQVKEPRQLQSFLNETFKNDTIWQYEALVVEEYIDTDFSVSGGSPSVEVYVNDDGPIMPYLCEQLLSESGEFLGVGIGREAVPQWLIDKLNPAVMAIGREYHRYGYRGFFDVDFVLSKSGVPYAVETNVRRTGGDHVYDIGRNLWGDDQSHWGYLLSEDSFFYGQDTLPVDQIINRLDHLLYPINASREGIVITVISETDPFLGYVIAAEDKSKAISLRDNLMDIFS